MSSDLKNKVAVITGGAQGIGFEIADNFSKNGATVIILDIKEDTGNLAAQTLTAKYGNKVEFFKCDVTKDREALSEAIINEYKTVDILVNNAGIGDEISIRRTMEVNTIAVMEWTMTFLEHMRTDKSGKGGTIINIASTYGFRTDPFAPYYKASKHAVMGFTKTLGHKDNYAKSGVRVVAICPGFTDTDLVPKRESKEVRGAFIEFLETSPWQKADAVGRAAVEVFERAESGTAWIIEGDRPIEQVL